jgi:hypothetical protein
MAKRAQRPQNAERFPVICSLNQSRAAPATAYRSRGEYGELNRHPDDCRSGDSPSLLESTRSKRACGKLRGVPRLMHLAMGRRKVVRRQWLQEWLETGKTQ